MLQGLINLNEEQKEHYNRNILVEEVGEEGQEKLLNSSVLVVGTGGLGSASLLYLCAAGVGRLGIIDSDWVDLSNLQRQVLHGHRDLGMPKTQSARHKLENLNKDIEIVSHQVRLTMENAENLISGYDIIIDGSDNIYTRYIMNEVCCKVGKPVIFGAVKGFSGQVTTVIPELSPCYLCLFPRTFVDIPKRGEAQGIIGTSPAIIGSIQATEALKLILGKGDLLTGRLLIFDSLTMRFTQINYRRNPNCPACGSGRKAVNSRKRKAEK